MLTRVGRHLGGRCSRQRRQTPGRRMLSSADRAEKFDGLFPVAPPLSEEAIAAAMRVLRSGNLHRYGSQEGPSEAALLERSSPRQWARGSPSLSRPVATPWRRRSARSASLPATRCYCDKCTLIDPFVTY